MDGFEHGWVVVVFIWVDVARGCDAHATCDCSAEVGDDIAKHVGDNDDVVDFWFCSHVHAACVDVVVITFDIWVVGVADFVECTEPSVATESEDVGFVYESKAAWVASCFTSACEIESVTEATFCTEACCDHFLGGDFVRCIFTSGTTVATVEVFCVFANTDEVDVFRGLVGERSVDAIVEFDWAKVDVLVKVETHLEKEALFEDAWLDVWVAYCTEIDSVVVFEFFDVSIGEDFAGFHVAFATEIEVFGVVLEVIEFGNSFEDFKSFSDYFWASAVTADDGEVECHGEFSGLKHPSPRRKSNGCGCQMLAD